jgi:PAS domain S-box-containing protein
MHILESVSGGGKSGVMKLPSLISEYRVCERALHEAIKAERVASIREYDIRMNWLRNIIREHIATSPSDKLMQIEFFMESISLASDIAPVDTLFSDLRAIVTRYVAKTPAAHNQVEIPGGPGGQLIKKPEKTTDFTAMIEKTDLRIAAFGKDLRYTYVSPANGRYHDMPAREICGRHVSELIGNARYEKRAKRYFDKCFGGEDQCYYYYLDSKRHGRQLMECRMLAQRDADNDVLGAVVLMRDLTNGFDDPLRSAEENRV